MIISPAYDGKQVFLLMADGREMNGILTETARTQIHLKCKGADDVTTHWIVRRSAIVALGVNE